MKQVFLIDKGLRNSQLFGDFNEKILMAILEPSNLMTISYLRRVCKRFNHTILKRANDFHNFDSLNFVSNFTNIHLLKIIQRFSHIKIFKIQSKITTSELMRFLDIIKTTITEFHTSDSHIDFSKLFRTIKLPSLLRFVFTNTKKAI